MRRWLSHWERMLALLTGIASAVALLVPSTRDVLEDRPLLGWGLFVAVLLLWPVAATVSEQRRQRETIREAHNRKDIDLLLDRLTVDLLRGGRLYAWLAEGAPPLYPMWAIQRMEELYNDWLDDERLLHDDEFTHLWGETVEAFGEYLRCTGENLWLRDRGPGTAADAEWLRVPVEWESHDYARFMRAHERLSQAHFRADAAVRALHVLTHERSP